MKACMWCDEVNRVNEVGLCSRCEDKVEEYDREEKDFSEEERKTIEEYEEYMGISEVRREIKGGM